MNGLTSAEATERLKHYGPNRLLPATQRAVVLQFLAHFRNPLIVILLVASGISALSGDVAGAIIIGLIPADARLLEANDIFVNQAQLTGEPFPVEKTPRPPVWVIFVIRTRRNPLRSQPNRWLVFTSLSVVLVAMALPFTPLAPYLGFSPLPMSFFGLLTGLLIAYLLAVEGGKQWFYKRLMK